MGSYNSNKIENYDLRECTFELLLPFLNEEWYAIRKKTDSVVQINSFQSH